MIICFDLETTGLDKYNDEIIEIAMVKFDEKSFKIIDTFSTLVNPQKDIPEIVSNITNIFNSDVTDSPILNDLKKEILEFIGDTPLLGHNVNFDRDFFIEKGINIKNNIYLDTFALANFLVFNEQSFNLEMLCKSFNIPFTGAHRAINDVNATIGLFKKLLEKFNKLSLLKKELLLYIFNQSEDKNISYLRDLLFLDVKQIDFQKFEKNILKKIGKYKDDLEIMHDESIKIKKTSDIFNNLGNLVIRQNQVKMTKIIFDNFEKNNKIVIEAPTGLGKSFAYLIPSIFHSLKTGEKVFISTKTKNLQDQLYYKDLKYLEDNLGHNFNYLKLKGKKNYLSIKSFFDEFDLGNIAYEKVFFLSKILLWIFETKYGELDELNYFGAEFSYLKLLNSNLSFYSKEDSSYLKYEFLYKARQKLEKSNIVVINNSLLFSDLKNENSILGKMDNLIIDEAHTIEESITDSLKKSVNYKILDDIFSVIEKILTKKKVNKIDFLNLKENLFSKLDLIFDYVGSYINLKISDNSKYKTTLLCEDFFKENDFGELVKKINLDFLSIIDNLSVIEEYDFSKEKLLLEESLNLFNIVLDKKTDNKYIKILSYSEHIGVSLEYTLLNPGEYLKCNLYDKLKSLTLTSATLKIGNNFDYFKNLLYLNDFDFYSFESDFNYKKQATLFIPNNLGSIKNNSEEIINFLHDFFTIVRGKTLALLTSFNMIKKIYTHSNIKLKKEGINLYAQSIGGSKIKLLNSFLESTSNSVLLGTNSFWEGVDIPGDDLKYLVIHKFPFSVPTDPVFQARSIFFKDPFLDYSVPKAIIKLKQGFGRLIRTHNDTGLVILLDDRIINTKWGKNFLDAFPAEINIKQGSTNQFIEILNKLK